MWESIISTFTECVTIETKTKRQKECKFKRIKYYKLLKKICAVTAPAQFVSSY